MSTSIKRFKPVTHNDGFSLLEVLIAMVIIGIGLLALSATGGNQIRQLSQLQEQTLAHWVAQNVITETRLGINAASAVAGDRQGEARMGTRNWYWQLHAEPASDPALTRLDVVVYSDRQYQNLVLAETGFSLSPR